MSKRKGGHPAKKGWIPLALTIPQHNAKAQQFDPEQYARDMADYASGVQSMWINNRYVVIRKELKDGFTWLSIRHIDRKPIRDWRHFQRIKNELCGEDREGYELYPAEDRLVDEANQYHIWVLPKGMRMPLGFNERFVGDDDAAAAIGAVQRPFEEEA